MKMMKYVILGLWILAMAGTAQAGYLSSGLEEQISTMQDDDVIQVLVVLADQADIATLDRDLHDNRVGMSQRHQIVLETLQDTALRSQGGLLSQLEGDRASGDILGYTSHWLVNSVVVKGSVSSIRRLAERQDVEVIEADLLVELIKPVLSDKHVAPGDRSIGITPGVVAVGARRVWDELGIDGSGVVVGNLDTGVDRNHVALQDRWRGNFAPVEECWLDAANLGHSLPQDNHGHGSHTMGTIMGLAADDSIGVAPGALWIASNIIISSTGTAFDNGVIASLEFMADPDGDPGTIDDMPVVVQNSWGVNENFSGYYDCDSRWWDAIDNCEAAGVCLTWSAGNEGSGSTTLRSPADRAASPGNCFSVGSTLHSPPYTISYFSSRGPSGCGGEFAMKPEIVAPGSDIYSVNAGGGYTYMSGTSMSGPHLAGVVALMRASNPDVDVTTVKQVLMATAIDLGPVGEDNTYGHGFVDAYEAVLAVMGGIGMVEGHITDSGSGLPIEGAIVRKVGGFNTATTDAEGYYSMTMSAEYVEFTVEAFGYADGFFGVTIPEDGSVNGDLALNLLPSGVVSGIVYNQSSAPVSGAVITVLDTPLDPVVSGPNGAYAVTLPAAPGSFYDIQAAASGYSTVVHNIEVTGDLTHDFHLPSWSGEDFESGNFDQNDWVMGGNAPWIISTSAHEGQYSARSGDIGDQQNSSLSITMDVAAASDISFMYMVSSEANYDYLIFSIDGNEQGSWAGTVPWTEFSVAVAPGTHTFRWNYDKDYSVSTGADAAWVDYIEFPMNAIPNITLDVTELSEFMVPGVGISTQTMTISNTGQALLIWDIDLRSSGGIDRGVTDVSWVSADPLSGQLNAGAEAEVDVTFSADGLDPGVYTAEMLINSNDPDNPSIELPVTLTIEDLTAVDEDLPGALSLEGAVPNPFNPSTNILFSLPRTARVELNLYDVSGHLVRSLVNGELAAGRHSAHWNGKDNSGRGVASGTYFARLLVEGEHSVKAMVLLK